MAAPFAPKLGGAKPRGCAIVIRQKQ